MWRVDPLVLREGDRSVLERRVGAHRAEHRDVTRARVVLLAADGVSGRQISKQIGLSEQAVCKWRQRYVAEGLAGLVDRPRSGRPPVYGPTDRLVLTAKATEERPEVDSQWSHASLAEAMGGAGIGMSASQIGRILAGLDIKPHLVRGWLNRKDTPEFWERAADVCGLYLSPPQNAIVLSIDEKTAIGARSRKHPTRRAQAGRVERQEFEYVRHGTACLMAAMDVATGEVLATDTPRNDSVNFISFLDDIDRVVAPWLEIHVVMDNGSSHTSKATKRWLADHPRFVVHHTPAHASWLNQVEAFFSILTRKLLRRGEFDSRQDLVDQIMAFIADHDHTATPFNWTYDARPEATCHMGLTSARHH